jgi:hypothetical protein
MTIKRDDFPSHCSLCKTPPFKRFSYWEVHRLTKKHLKNIQNISDTDKLQKVDTSTSEIDLLKQELLLYKAKCDALQFEIQVNNCKNVDHQRIELELLRSQLKINTNTTINTNNIVNNTTNNINITIRAHGTENWDHLAEEEVFRIMKGVNSCIPEMVKLIHFDIEHPENQNIAIPNKKLPQVKVFNGDNWSIQDKNETIDRLVANMLDTLNYKYEDEFFKRFASPFIARLWSDRYDELTNESNKHNKNTLKEVRREVEFCILNNQKSKQYI